MKFTLGTPFSLKSGQSAALADDSLRVGMEAVIGDSRCPKGHQCIWAGEAIVRLWVQQRGRAKQTLELRTSASASQQSIGSGQHTVQLLRVDPYPIGDRSIAASDYSATLAVHAGAPPGSGGGTAAER